MVEGFADNDSSMAQVIKLQSAQRPPATDPAEVRDTVLRHAGLARSLSDRIVVTLHQGLPLPINASISCTAAHSRLYPYLPSLSLSHCQLAPSYAAIATWRGSNQGFHGLTQVIYHAQPGRDTDNPSSSTPSAPDNLATHPPNRAPYFTEWSRQCSPRWILQNYPIAPQWQPTRVVLALQRCNTRHPCCPSEMRWVHESPDLQGNHTQTGTRPHNGLRHAVALARGGG